MTDIPNRLRTAREKAGFSSAAEAASRFGWNYPTYAGHENGHRGIKADVLRIYARAFKVDVGWLVGGDPLRQPPPVRPGFSESEVEPLAGIKMKNARTIEDLAVAVSPRSKHQMVLRCKRDQIGLGLRRGDLLVIGTPERPATHDIVAVNLVDEEHGIATSVLRQMKGNVLFAPFGQELDGEDGMTADILGHVVAVLRAPELID
jgi:transcriptional regulator with XRE-family HTH domain